ncbi:hypothetical protein BJ138DRAFT_1007149 [Hygrophoropsis aurantiaca]|uniref:Uncharacterized protein n=1 Tax=Hygrophoropsis aurantiaca TaxID=72124 RepID=A0ACB8ACX2_9AGAM|nr:hypothetical protein BJ138DRAFT_1007149 [Hygrophoropsis aurantiaca]
MARFLVNRSGISFASLITLAIVIGVFVGFSLSTFGYLPDGVACALPFAGQDALTPANSSPSPSPTPSPSSTQLTVDPVTEYLEEIQNIVSRTKGFYARDYSLWLGWNNMRYIIETALLHGALLNRTVILPSFIYARACEYDNAACAAYATMVNRGDATGSDEWRNLPIDQQMAWRVPIATMFNMTHLRRTHSVITVSDFLRLHNISSDTETSDGHFDMDLYLNGTNVFHEEGRTLSIHAIENEWYDPGGVVRVDSLPEDMRLRGGWSFEGGEPDRDMAGSWNDTEPTPLYLQLVDAQRGGNIIVDWPTVRRVTTYHGYSLDNSTDEEVEQVIKENGWAVLYTYDGAAGMEYVQDVVNPIRQATARHHLRGHREDYGNITADVLFLRGEVHWGRKPGAMRFTTSTARDGYSDMVLHQLRMTDNILQLAERLDQRMLNITGGRMWMCGHMRRGDFARLHWAQENSFAGHLARIKKHLADGRNVLRTLNYDTLSTYNVPGAHPDESILRLDPPSEEDKFYIATDERDPGNLQYLEDRGGILITDLLTIDDRREFGWPLMLTDVLSLLEQATLARGAYFYAHAMSSVAGGVVNLRAVNGRDPRTAILE